VELQKNVNPTANTCFRAQKRKKYVATVPLNIPSSFRAAHIWGGASSPNLLNKSFPRARVSIPRVLLCPLAAAVAGNKAAAARGGRRSPHGHWSSPTGPSKMRRHGARVVPTAGSNFLGRRRAGTCWALSPTRSGVAVAIERAAAGDKQPIDTGEGPTRDNHGRRSIDCNTTSPRCGGSVVHVLKLRNRCWGLMLIKSSSIDSL
jgi:hypothetical protein